MKHYSGTTKITNQKTLQSWKVKGWFDELINSGFIFNSGCGRFKKEICKCCKCK